MQKQSDYMEIKARRRKASQLKAISSTLVKAAQWLVYSAQYLTLVIPLRNATLKRFSLSCQANIVSKFNCIAGNSVGLIRYEC